MVRPRYNQSHIAERQHVFRDVHGRVQQNDQGEAIIGAPVDGDSIVKRHFGNIAYGTQIAIGIEQLLHPQIGAAVEYTQKFWNNPYNRVAVSMDPIMAVVYADDPYVAGDRVRQFHEQINGRDHKGRRFNALDPTAFYWAHETFRRGVQNLAEHYSQETFADEQRRQLQHESATWFSYYGMPMNMVPASYEANVEYRRSVVENVLEMNPSAERAIDLAVNRQPPRPESVPKAVWPLAKLALIPVTEAMSLITIGELPEEIRHKFGIPFSKDDQKHLDDIRNVIKTFEAPIPDPLQYATVYDAIRRDRGGHDETLIDAITYSGLTIGKEVARRTVIPLLRNAQQSVNSIRAIIERK